MSSVIKTLLSLSLSGSLLMGLLALLRPVYRGRTSLRWQYYIWLAVVLRMLLPIAPEANLMEAVLGEQAASVIPAAKRLRSIPGGMVLGSERSGGARGSLFLPAIT